MSPATSSPVRTAPNFFIVGAPKAGTTSLYYYLDQHPQIYMSPIKEPCYFASELRPENFSKEFQQQAMREMHAVREYLDGPMREKRFGGLVLQWEHYLKLFQHVKGEKAIGEASVFYLWSKTAAANILTRIPDAKIIMILRNPTERAYSQYLHTVTNGLVRRSFREQIQRSLRNKSQRFSILYPFLECGLYYEQVKRYLDLFPGQHIRIYFFEEYQKKPTQILTDIFRFLNVDLDFTPDISQKHLEPQVPKYVTISYLLKKYGIWQYVKKLSPHALRSLYHTFAFRQRKFLVMEQNDKELLIDYYQEDIRKLSSLMDRDFSAWLC